MIDQHFASSAATSDSLADVSQPVTCLPDESSQAVASATVSMIIARSLGEYDGRADAAAAAADAAPPSPARHSPTAAVVQPSRSNSLPPISPSAADAQAGAAAGEFDAFIAASDRR